MLIVCVGEFNVCNSSLPLDMETCSTCTPRAPQDQQERPWTWPRLTLHHYPPHLHRPWCHAPTRHPTSLRMRLTSTWPSRRARYTGTKIHSCKIFYIIPGKPWHSQKLFLKRTKRISLPGQKWKGEIRWSFCPFGVPLFPNVLEIGISFEEIHSCKRLI